jgi:hypothetical protein
LVVVFVVVDAVEAGCARVFEFVETPVIVFAHTGAVERAQLEAGC